MRSFIFFFVLRCGIIFFVVPEPVEGPNIPILELKMTVDRKKYKSFALMQLKGRWRPAVIATLISVLILTLFSVTQNQTTDLSFSEMMRLSEEQLFNYIQSNPQFSAPGIILSLIETIMDFIIDIVLVSFFLIYSRSPEPVTLKNYFEGYNKWGRGVLCGLWKLLWLFLWALIVIPVMVGFVLIIALLSNSYEFSAEFQLVLLTIVMLIGLIPMFIKSIEYSFATYFTAEFSELGIRKALRHSITLAKGHRWELFLLDLSFIGWFLASMLTAGIGFMWFLPYYYMTKTNTYHALLQDALENSKILPEDLN